MSSKPYAIPDTYLISWTSQNLFGTRPPKVPAWPENTLKEFSRERKDQLLRDYPEQLVVFSLKRQQFEHTGINYQKVELDAIISKVSKLRTTRNTGLLTTGVWAPPTLQSVAYDDVSQVTAVVAAVPARIDVGTYSMNIAGFDSSPLPVSTVTTTGGGATQTLMRIVGSLDPATYTVRVRYDHPSGQTTELSNALSLVVESQGGGAPN